MKLRTISEALDEIALWASSHHQIAALLLFGSYVRSEETSISDLDFAYLLDKEIPDPRKDEVDKEIYFRITSILDSDNVTLINLEEAPPIIAFRALCDGKLLSCHYPEKLTDFKEGLLLVYPDIKRLRDEVLFEFRPGRKEGKVDIDREKILYHLRLIEENLTRIKEKTGMTQEEYLANEDAQIIVERSFHRAIESCLSIGNHLISRQGLKLAEDYASVFVTLAESRVISQELAQKMAGLARFRNLLVHVYWSLDHRRIYREISDNIAALESFINTVWGLFSNK